MKTKTDISMLYKKLRKLVDEQYAITLIDNNYLGHANVAISPVTKDFPWTHFEGHSLEEALVRAIHKLEHPDENHVALDGHVWKATEPSCFSARHIKPFLRKVKTIE